MKKIAMAVITLCVWLAVTPAAQAKVVTGGAGNDELFGGGRSDKLSGFGGGDYLFGRGSADELFGGIGDDTLIGAAGKDLYIGEAGSDTLIDGAGGRNPETLDGREDNDLLISYDGKADDLYCGTGTDIALGDTVDFRTGCETTRYTDGSVTWFGITFTVKFGSHGEEPVAEIVDGTAGSDILLGGQGADDIYAETGTWDLLVGGPGDDSMFGGEGFDQIYDDDGKPSDLLSGGGGGDTLFSVDGAADGLTCGTGTDTAYADPTDTVNPDCETVIRQTTL